MWNFVKEIPGWLARRVSASSGQEARADARYCGNASTRNNFQSYDSMRRVNPIFLCLIGIATLHPVVVVFAAERCPATAAARVVSVQGNVTRSLINATAQQAAKLNDSLCVGDTVRVGAKSRAVLRLPNETTIPLDQNTIFRLKQSISEKEPTLIDLIQGAIHVITRTPKPFKVDTPYLNATVEGTEFYVGVDSTETRVMVIEGKVNVSNELGALLLVDNEAATAKKGQAPQRTLTIKPRDAVQWALYYPPLFDPRSRTGGQNLSASYYLFSQGKITEAIESLGAIPEAERNGDYYTYRAGLLLLVGRADEAEPDIETALKENGNNTDALSLKAIIAIVQNDKARALELANQAVNIDDKSASARIALSYALQADFKIEEALKAARQATERDANNALAWARVAELELSVGALDKAQQAAQRAETLNPNLARTQSVLGFANLTRINIKAAKESFNKAIELDQADPLPRLGLGLATIREGDVANGRGEIEIAVSLDPESSLIRSYLGKAYYEERRDVEAGKQFGLAKERDPKDPTPYFYDAIRRYADNNPIESLELAEKAIALNDRRAVLRSRLLLDNDAASRAATQASVLETAGFTQLALSRAYRSWMEDPSNALGHRFLADAYASQPRHEQARASELLQGQLLEGQRIIRSDPLVIDDRSGPKFRVVSGTAFRLGNSEYSSLFDPKGASLLIDGLAASQKTLADSVAVEGTFNAASLGLSQFHYETEGFEENSDVRRDVYDAVLKVRITASTNLLAEVAKVQTNRGETLFGFDPDAIEKRRFTEDSESVRIGVRHRLTPDSDLLFLGMYRKRDTTNPLIDETAFLANRETARLNEAQYILHRDEFKIVAGISWLNSDVETLGQAGAESRRSHRSAFVLGTASPFSSVSTNFGLGFDEIFKDDLRQRRQFSPRFGVTWNITPGTVVRVANFKSVKKRLIANQTLEPTQIAGFNQFYDDVNGTIARRTGIGIDHQLGSKIYVGGELTRRKLTVPLEVLGGIEDYTWREKGSKAYLYAALPARSHRPRFSNWSFASGLEFEFEELTRPEELTGTESILDIKTRIVPLFLRGFNSKGFSFRISQSWARQRGHLQFFPGFNRFTVDEKFTVTDIEVMYQFPKRRGGILLGVKNVFAEKFSFLETDPINRRFVPDRYFFGRLSVQF